MGGIGRVRALASSIYIGLPYADKRERAAGADKYTSILGEIVEMATEREASVVVAAARSSCYRPSATYVYTE
jgi:hypothetical protein